MLAHGSTTSLFQTQSQLDDEEDDDDDDEEDDEEDVDDDDDDRDDEDDDAELELLSGSKKPYCLAKSGLATRMRFTKSWYVCRDDGWPKSLMNIGKLYSSA